MLTNPDFLILDEPTRGIDVGTKAEIQHLVLKLAEEGKAVIFISSEIEEMLRTCSRMVVMRDSSKVSELSGDEITEDNIMKAIAGEVNMNKFFSYETIRSFQLFLPYCACFWFLL